MSKATLAKCNEWTQILPISIERLYYVEDLLLAGGGYMRIVDPISSTKVGVEVLKQNSYVNLNLI